MDACHCKHTTNLSFEPYLNLWYPIFIIVQRVKVAEVQNAAGDFDKTNGSSGPFARGGAAKKNISKRFVAELGVS